MSDYFFNIHLHVISSISSSRRSGVRHAIQMLLIFTLISYTPLASSRVDTLCPPSDLWPLLTSLSDTCLPGNSRIESGQRGDQAPPSCESQSRCETISILQLNKADLTGKANLTSMLPFLSFHFADTRLFSCSFLLFASLCNVYFLIWFWFLWAYTTQPRASLFCFLPLGIFFCWSQF